MMAHYKYPGFINIGLSHSVRGNSFSLIPHISGQCIRVPTYEILLQGQIQVHDGSILVLRVRWWINDFKPGLLVHIT